MLTELDFPPESAPSRIADQVKGVWARSKVIHIRGPRPEGDLREYYGAFFEQVGRPLRLAEDARIRDRNAQRTGEIWFEVRYDPSVPDAYRHSAQAQPLHTDGSYIPGFPNAGFLACQAMPAEGGATVFIDAVDLVEALKAEAPDLLDALVGTDVPHSRSGDRRTETVIRFEEGEPLVNWNYFCVDPEGGDEALALRERFAEFLRTSPAVAAATRRVKLSPGDAVLWKDDRVLHGRDAFNPEKPSDRFLWKAAIQVDG